MKIRARSSNGSSLVTVIGIGMISSLWISALMSMVIPGYEKASRGRTDIALRSSAGAALDWAVAQLNIKGNSIDDLTEDGAPGQPIQVPQAVLGQSGLPVTATVVVNNVRVPASSALYDPALDPANARSNGGITTNGWRMVTATSSCGKVSRSVRVILRPAYSAVPIFDYGLFGRSSLSLSGNMVIDSYDSSVGAYSASATNLGGDIGSNTRASLYGQLSVGGDVRVLSYPPGGTASVVSGAGSVIEGRLVVNGTINKTLGIPDFTNANVKGRLMDGTQSSNPIATQQHNDQKQLPPSPPAPLGAVDLGAVKLAGNQVLELSAPGDYVLNKLQISGNGKIVLKGSGPVRLYVRGATASIGISGNGIQNTGRPQDLQIYYNGSENSSITGNGTFNGVLYAPNSNVRIVGGGQLYGSIVGNQVNLVGNGGFHYDRSLANLNTNSTLSLSRMQTVSWQEL